MRLGIMSFAHVHADGFLQILRKLQDVEFVGFSDTDKEQGKFFAELYGVPWFSSHEELLDQKLEGVVICSENANHLADVKLAAAAGVHILCEKPIATTLEDGLAIKEEIDKAGIKFMTAFPMRFDPSIVALKEMIERGDLGKIYAINGINHSEIPRRHRSWFADKKLAGGGAVMDHTVHLLDLYRWLLDSEASDLYAEVANPFTPDAEIDTAGLVTLSFANGVFASIDCSWSRPEAVYPRWGHLKMEVIGEQGAIAVDAFNQYLNYYSKQNSRQANWLGWGSDSSTAMVQEFINSIKEDRDPSIGWKDGFEALKVALACYDAAKAKQVVKL
ncbi:MAG: Gfo/Idh/MocA family oxidoreductase [Trueperaceae bacterium]|nr:Gfo/Idh/MocA family oxidoreductase [Trueperaceae bacterium]